MKHLSAVQRVAKNTTVLLIAQVASYLLAFFYMMYIARYLGAAGFGILSFALAFTGIFAAFTGIFSSIFWAFERMEYRGVGQMLNSALILGGVIFAIKHTEESL